MTNNPYGKKKSTVESAVENSTDKTVSQTAQEPTVTSNSNAGGGRKMTVKRKLVFAVLQPLLWLFVNFLWLSCRVKVLGENNLDAVLASQKAAIPCYWHQQHLFCGWLMLKQIKRGMKVGFLISPSVDGEIPAKIVAARGARVIRGSSTRTGAQALREMYQLIAKEGVSPVTTSDGPTGPIFKFKPGAAMLAKMTAVPMLPIACAAKNAWYLGSWDRFMIPKPFSKVVVAVGEPVYVGSDHSSKDFSPVQTRMEELINGLMVKAKENL